MDIYLIRHGKTAATEQQLYCGQTDLPLSEEGALSIADLKRQGAYPKGAQLYFTSGFLRAEQTLNIICGPVSRTALPELAEYNFGRFEMKSHEELNGQDGYQAWINDQTGLVACPRGESKQQFEQRVLAGYQLLVSKSQGVGTVLAVCHGGVITCVMAHLFPDAHKNFYEWHPEPGHGYKLTYNAQEACQYKKI